MDLKARVDAGRDDRQAEQHDAQGQVDDLDREEAQQDREDARLGDVGDVALPPVAMCLRDPRPSPSHTAPAGEDLTTLSRNT